MLGAPVACTDGKCGVLHSLVVDPGRRRVTHLVVEPELRIGLGRLVSIGLVGSADDEVNLSCDLAAFNSLPRAESTEVVKESLRRLHLFAQHRAIEARGARRSSLKARRAYKRARRSWLPMAILGWLAAF